MAKINHKGLYLEGRCVARDRGDRMTSRGDGAHRGEAERKRLENIALLTVEEGAISQSIQATSRSWNKLRKGFSPRASNRNRSLPTLWF